MIQVGSTLTTSDKVQRGICMVIWRHAWDWYWYSTTLHSNRSNHEARQAEIEKNEARMDSQDQGKSWELVQCKISESS